jgi:hypothetical protein
MGACQSGLKISPGLPATAAVALLAACLSAHGKERVDNSAAIADAGALLAGRYDNSKQVAEGKGQHPPPQHVSITIQPTGESGWELWRVHMDVDPELAESAGSDTSLDAVWAMNITQTADKKSLQMIPYTLRPSVDMASVDAPAFDKAQWLSLEACMLRGDFRTSRIVLQVPPDEMCVAVTMGLGGKRAFLPSAVEREGDWLHVQLMYFGRPWRVDAHRE